MEQTRYKTAICVPQRVTATLFELDCIYSVHKEAEGKPVYLLYDWDDEGRYVELRPGQWLCQDYEGRWTVKDKL